MSQPLVCELDETRELDAVVSDEVLRRAVAEWASVRLLVAAGPVERAVHAELIGLDRCSLVLRLRDLAEIPDWLLGSATVRVTLETMKSPYVFETVCLRNRTTEGATCVRVQRPRTLAAIERRRSGRKALHEPAEVTLAHVDGVSPFSCRAAMLNVSADGLACRVTAGDAERLRSADDVRASFYVGDDPDSFEMVCRITNETRGGTPDTVVLGMAFVQGKNSPSCTMRIRTAMRSNDRD